MRKIISFILACTMVAALLSGCGSSGPIKGYTTMDPDLGGYVSGESQNPVATIEMSDGSIIKAELYPDVAPNTVNNFIYLANNGFYDGLTFHRCISGFMIQGGDPNGNGSGGPGYSIKGEFSNNGITNDLKHTKGVLSMARTSDYDGAGSQFFIMVSTRPNLDGDYAAFGNVTEGIEYVEAIADTEVDENSKPVTDQVIKSITVDTFGVYYPVPEVITE